MKANLTTYELRKLNRGEEPHNPGVEDGSGSTLGLREGDGVVERGGEGEGEGEGSFIEPNRILHGASSCERMFGAKISVGGVLLSRADDFGLPDDPSVELGVPNVVVSPTAGVPVGDAADRSSGMSEEAELVPSRAVLLPLLPPLPYPGDSE